MAFKRYRATRSWVRAALVTSALAWALPAFASPTPVDRESARALMDEGDTRFDAHSYEAALQAYDAANSIMKVPTTGYAVAKTLAALGRLVEARDAAMLVVHMPLEGKETRPFVQARAAAEALANDVEHSIASLAITVEGISAGEVRVDIDGIPMPAALLSLPRKTDPGAHVVRASAPGFVDEQREVTLAKGESASVTLQLHRLSAPEQPVSAGVVPTGSGVGTTPLSPVQRTPKMPLASPDSGATARSTGLVVAASGAALVAVGGLLALSASSKYHSVDVDCPEGACDASAFNTRNDARSRGVLATVVTALGGAALAGGVAVYLLAPSASTRVGLSANGAVLKGTF